MGEISNFGRVIMPHSPLISRDSTDTMGKSNDFVRNPLASYALQSKKGTDLKKGLIYLFTGGWTVTLGGGRGINHLDFRPPQV